jgi:hypothetical protein
MLSKALLTYGGLVLLVAATYPLALLGQFAVDMLYGDAEIARDALYGYKRLLAARLIDGWLGSLVWVIGFWLAILALRRFLPRLWLPVVVVAVLVASTVAVGGFAPIPLVFAWLLLAAVLLHGVYRAARARLMED